LEVNHDQLDEEELQEIRIQFGSVQACMLSLYQGVSGGALWGTSNRILAASVEIYSLALTLFVVFYWFALMNIQTGLIVESVATAASHDDTLAESEFKRKRTAAMQGVKRVFKALDSDGNGTIGVDEFFEGIRDEKVHVLLQQADLDVKNAEFFFSSLLEATEDTCGDIDSFVNGCMKMKGAATSIDLQLLHIEVRVMMKKLARFEAMFGLNSRAGKPQLR
jgi:hypothetical protein